MSIGKSFLHWPTQKNTHAKSMAPEHARAWQLRDGPGSVGPATPSLESFAHAHKSLTIGVPTYRAYMSQTTHFPSSSRPAAHRLDLKIPSAGGRRDAFRLQPSPPHPPPPPQPSAAALYRATIVEMAGPAAKITKFFQRTAGRVRGSAGRRDPGVAAGNAAGGSRPSGGGLVSLLAFRVCSDLLGW